MCAKIEENWARHKIAHIRSGSNVLNLLFLHFTTGSTLLWIEITIFIRTEEEQHRNEVILQSSLGVYITTQLLCASPEIYQGKIGLRFFDILQEVPG